jgi:hypothetical protein
MTDEERQKLVDDLWLIASHDRPVSHAICAEAAEEIERLAEEIKNWEVWAMSQPGYSYKPNLRQGYPDEDD